MSHTGLKRVTKTVRGKKGSVKRTYWVRADRPSSRKNTEKPQRATGENFARGGGRLGAAIGAWSGGHIGLRVGRELHGTPGAMIGAGTGWATGSKTGRALGQIIGNTAGRRMSPTAERNAGYAATGLAGAVHGYMVYRKIADYADSRRGTAQAHHGAS